MKAQFSEATRRYAVIDEERRWRMAMTPRRLMLVLRRHAHEVAQSAFVEREKARDLDRKFDDALVAAKKRATVLSRGSVIEAMNTLAAIVAREAADKTAAALVIDAELIAGMIHLPKSPPLAACSNCAGCRSAGNCRPRLTPRSPPSARCLAPSTPLVRKITSVNVSG